MKRQVDRLNAVPSKRLFLSIIADYDLNKSVCELVDNAFDMWTRSGRVRPINIHIILDRDTNRIIVEDDAGGVDRDDLPAIVGPGQSGSNSTDETIGIFGVGTKRAVVAMAEDIKIVTRVAGAPTYQVEFDDDWLKEEEWLLPLFEVSDISAGTTRVELSRLRLSIDDGAETQLRSHLGATYAKFLILEHVSLRLNGTAIEARFFDRWSYPPKYEPRRYAGNLSTPKDRSVEVEVLAGLSNESSPATGDYGVYFYCNDRLVAPAIKSIDVGFARGLAGIPHPKVSLTKVIVSMRGDAEAMPWNSSKSEISTKHHTFLALHQWLVTVVSDYARISRTLEGHWPEQVFAYQQGKITDVPIEQSIAANKSYLPDPPASRPRLPERVAKKNQRLAKRKPYVVGLYEGMVAAVSVARQPLRNANWLSLNLLAITLTGALKTYLVRETTARLSNREIKALLTEPETSAKLRKLVPLSDKRWQQIDALREQVDVLTFSEAAPAVSDTDREGAEDLVQYVLRKLFKIDTVA